MKSRKTILSFMVFFALLGSCGTEPELNLLDPAASDWEERRRRLDVLVEPEVGGEFQAGTELPPENFRFMVADHCEQVVRAVWSYRSCDAGPATASGARNVATRPLLLGFMPACAPTGAGAGLAAPQDSAACWDQLSLCMAQTYLELARTAEPVILTTASGRYRVRPQTVATNAGLGEAALDFAEYAAILAGESLRRGAGDTSSIVPICARDTSLVRGVHAVNGGEAIQTYAEAFAANLVEASRLAEEAAEYAVRDNVAVADEDLARIPDRGLAARTGWMAPVLSRLHGAQLATGGTDFYAVPTSGSAPSGPPGPGLLQTGICAIECTGPCRDALRVIRDSGVPLGEFLGAPDLRDALGGSVGYGSVADRLGERFDDPELSGGDADDLLDRLHLSAHDFENARAYLGQEVSVFDRDTLAVLPAPIIPTGTHVSAYTYYAATVHPPAETPPLFFTASARATSATDNDVGQAGLVYPTPTYARRSLAHTLDYVQTVSRQILRWSAPASFATVQDTLGTVVAMGEGTGTARVVSCFQSAPGASDAEIRVHGRASPATLRLVSGTAGLHCATTGLVEGQPCRLADHTVAGTSATPIASTDAREGYDGFVRFSVPSVPPDALRWYVVEEREGTSEPAAGDYDVIGEVSLPDAADRPQRPGGLTGFTFCHALPFDAFSTELAARSMSVSTDTCNLPANDCYGVAHGQIPLEDILIDDGSGTENSFRYHLNRAAAAAAESDRLAEELVQAGLVMDERAERALETIEEQCGATINVDPFLATAGTEGERSLSGMVAGRCDPMDECVEGYTCVAGNCILDLGARAIGAPEDDYNTEVLSECLGLGGEEDIVPRVGLGSSRICVVFDAAAPNVLCPPGLAGDRPCPQTVRPGADCPPGWTPIEAGELLGLIPARDLGDVLLGWHAVGDFSGVCRDLRRARSTGDVAAVQRIVESDFFSFDNVRYWAQRIGWRGYPLDYSELTIDGAPWYGTGQPFLEWARDADGMPDADDRPMGPSLAWPCTGAYRMAIPMDYCAADGMFCDRSTVCSSQASRANWNARAARAALVLGMTSGYGLGNLWLPTAYGPGGTPLGSLEGRSRVHDEFGRVWEIASGGDGCEERSGLVAIPTDLPGSPGADVVVWTGTPRDWTPLLHHSTGAAPIAFFNFGEQAGDFLDSTAEAYWSGMSSGPVPVLPDVFPGFGLLFDQCYGAGGFDLERSFRSVANPEDTARVALFRRALSGAPAGNGMVLLRGRGTSFGRGCEDLQGIVLTQYFRHPLFQCPGGPVNAAHMATVGFTGDDFLDAMELTCEAAVYAEEHETCDPANPPTVQTRDDLPQLRAYLSCLANRVETMGERVVLQDVPRRVIELVRNEPSAIRPDEGEYGRNVIALRDGLRGIGAIPRSIAQQLREIAAALELLELALSEVDAQQTIGELHTAMGAIDQAVACVSAAASGVGLGAVATCALAAAHIAIGLRVSDLEASIHDATRQAQLIRFRSQYEAAQERLAQLGEQLTTASEQANTSLSALRSGRRQARRNLGYALFLSSDEAGRHYAVNTVMRRRYNTLRIRYERAHRSAVQMAELARIALEQRLGLSLADIDRTDLTLVDNPRTWWNSACTSSGVDYAAIRGVDDIDGDNYAGAFIGDYVRNLERFFDTYRIDYPYVDGHDTTVISVRNDIARSAESCPSDAWNLLGASNELASAHEFLPDGRTVDEGDTSDSDSVPLAWNAAGCAPSGDGVVENCVSVSPISDPPDVPDTAGRTPPQAFRVLFAAGAPGDTPFAMTYTPAANWGQDVSVAPGLYRLSWYGRTTDMTPASLFRVDLVSIDAGTVTSNVPTPLLGGPGWLRYVRYFEVARAGTVRVRVLPDPSFTSTPVQHAIDLAGVQLEAVSDRISVAATSISQMDVTTNPRVYWPRDFIATTSRGTALFDTCEDVDGSVFRRGYWSYDCDARLCEAGVDRCRADEEGEWLCYWQSPVINLGADQFRDGGILERAGVARGSFNYRIDDIALNFVGTGSRVCSDPSRASSCYSSGYIQYSLSHDGPFPVIDRAGGATFQAPIFDAGIEQARGLAAERVITNPISPADRALLGDYTRTELRGRPLSGAFRIRVWDTGDVNFGGIEDVQVVLNYRYFTRAGRDEP